MLHNDFAEGLLNFHPIRLTIRLMDVMVGKRRRGGGHSG